MILELDRLWVRRFRGGVGRLDEELVQSHRVQIQVQFLLVGREKSRLAAQIRRRRLAHGRAGIERLWGLADCQVQAGPGYCRLRWLRCRTRFPAGTNVVQLGQEGGSVEGTVVFPVFVEGFQFRSTSFWGFQWIWGYTCQTIGTL